MTQKGTVVDVDKNANTLLVHLDREEGCEGCAKGKNGCTFACGCPFQTINADNRCQAEKGDSVLLQTVTSKMILAYVVIFLLPLLSAFGGAFAVYGIADGRLAVVCFFVLWIVVLIAVHFIAEKRKILRINYTAVEVLSKEDQGNER